MEWLSTNWLWVVLGLGVRGLLFKGGMGGRRTHNASTSVPAMS